MKMLTGIPRSHSSALVQQRFLFKVYEAQIRTQGARTICRFMRADETRNT